MGYLNRRIANERHKAKHRENGLCSICCEKLCKRNKWYCDYHAKKNAKNSRRWREKMERENG